MTSTEPNQFARQIAAARICTASDGAKVVPFPKPYQRHGYEPDDWYEDEIEDDEPEPSDRLWWAWLAVLGGGLALWLLPWLVAKMVGAV